jgi:hypothetical protein
MTVTPAKRPGVKPPPSSSGVRASGLGITPFEITRTSATTRYSWPVTTLEHEPLIRRVLGSNYLQLGWARLGIDEQPDGSTVKATVTEGDTTVEVEGKGVGLVDALHAALLARYGREYQSLKTIQLASFHVAADIGTKKGQAGVDAVGKVTLDVTNSEGRHFTFTDASRSVTASTARVVIAMVQYFVNAERAFLTLHNARRDAIARGREDLVSRYTAEMAEVVESTSYAEVIANIRKELG